MPKDDQSLKDWTAAYVRPEQLAWRDDHPDPPVPVRSISDALIWMCSIAGSTGGEVVRAASLICEAHMHGVEPFSFVEAGVRRFTSKRMMRSGVQALILTDWIDFDGNMLLQNSTREKWREKREPERKSLALQ